MVRKIFIALCLYFIFYGFTCYGQIDQNNQQSIETPKPEYNQFSVIFSMSSIEYFKQMMARKNNFDFTPQYSLENGLINISNIRFLEARPLGQNTVRELNELSVFVAIYYAIKNYYVSVSDSDIEKIFSSISFSDIEKIITDKERAYKLSDTDYQINFRFILNKKYLDSQVWKKSQNAAAGNDYFIDFVFYLNNINSIFNIENLLNQSGLKYQIVSYSRTKAVYKVETYSSYHDTITLLNKNNIVVNEKDGENIIGIIEDPENLNDNKTEDR
jgi:hypothetical protein